MNNLPNKIKKNKNKFLLLMSFVITFIALVFMLIIGNRVEPTEVKYTEFVEMVEDGKVDSVTIELKNGTKFTFLDNEEKEYITDNPKIDTFKEYLLSKNVEVIETNNKLGEMIASLSGTILYFILIMIVFRSAMPGKNNYKPKSEIPNITFDDIAGEKELKDDLHFVVEYLKHPEKYSTIGARMPKGIILYGPPGTGKTLTAKAIAGTAGVPFYSVSGSDFVEMYVGLGAKRVRDLFNTAKKTAPCIIFIDEIDAVGGKRNAIGGNSELNQTINALLNELDGFNGREGIITICATNRVEDLDVALIRPGRFDKQLSVPLPEREDRIEIFKIHSRGKKLASDIDFDELASMTVGFSGAAIESLLNESAFIAVNNNDTEITKEHIERAFFKIVMKGNRKENKSSRDKKELRIAAYHEAGHAIATKLYTDDNVSKVTIVASTSGAGGATFRTPQEMKLYSRKYMESLIKIMYAGRASEELCFGTRDEITTGASSDIKQSTMLIREYLSVYGMNDDIGMLNLTELTQNDSSSLLVSEAKKLSAKLYDDVKNDLKENFAMIEETAELLLEKESIDEKELDAIINKYKTA